MIQRVCTLTKSHNFIPLDANETSKTRVFLSSFMIAYHPEDAFDRRTLSNTRLEAAALAMLEVFGTLCDAIRGSRAGVDLTDAIGRAHHLPELVKDFTTQFYEWKAADAARVLAQSGHALVALYAVDTFLVDGQEETPAMRKMFHSEQVRLRSSVLKVAGAQALKVVSYTPNVEPSTIKPYL